MSCLMNKKNQAFMVISLVLGTLFLLCTTGQKIYAEELETKVIVHYESPEAEKDLDRTIWAWAEGASGQEVNLIEEDTFGKYAEVSVPGAHEKIGFLIKSKGDWSYQSKDQWVDSQSGRVHVWLDKEGELSYEPKNKELAPKTKDLTVKVHYYRGANDYDDWNVWYWLDGEEGQQADFDKSDEFGQVAEFNVKEESGFSNLNFSTRKSSADDPFSVKDGEDRKIYISQNQEKIDVWLMEADETVYGNPGFIVKEQEIKEVKIESLSQISVKFSKKAMLEELKSQDIRLLSEGKEVAIKEIKGKENEVTNKLILETVEPLELQKEYKLESKNGDTTLVGLGGVVRTPEFDEAYAFDGELGAIYASDKTDFVLWAPTAKKVELLLYEDQTETSAVKETLVMDKGEKGTYSTAVLGNQHGTAYSYRLTFSDGSVNESTDPYATSAIVNGNHSVVIDPSQVSISSFDRMAPFTNPVDAVIYEAHIRDLSIASDSGITNKGKFLGVIESGTKNNQGQPTGLDYIKSLGVSHVQFLPMYDYQTIDESQPETPQYNWGYDPKNYNVPEGSYSTDATDPTKRVVEMKQMVKGLHDNGLRVIMDVVYNHVYEANSHAFNQTVPGYYFRYEENGSYANGTGVGNDVASERKMAQKYIVDSIKYWAQNYQLDGFRFDLMGILDVETINLVRNELNQIDPSIIVLGEGWNMGTPLDESKKAIQKNANVMPGIAHFNDSIRDSVKGSVFEGTEPGMINGQAEMEELVAQNMLGANGLEGYISPNQVIQYVEAHDNLTLYDKLSLTNPLDTKEQRIKRHSLGTGIILTSQGVPFIHAGQEFLRTKGGDENSYKSPDSVNQFNWNQPAEYQHSVDFFKGLLSFRKDEELLRLADYKSIEEKAKILKSKEGVIIYSLVDGDKELLVAINSNEVAKPLDKKEIQSFKPVISNNLPNEQTKEGEMLPLSLTIYEKKREITETTETKNTEKEEILENKPSSETTERKTNKAGKVNPISSNDNKTKKEFYSLPKTGEKNSMWSVLGMGLLVIGSLLFKNYY